uniref:Uncharacterized protein n=1 Tax=Panagrolaimus sp. PS1159 TaxID=55785 RepID=A0AC35FH64_9BILA
MFEIFCSVQNSRREEYLVVAKGEDELMKVSVIGYKSKKIITEYEVAADSAMAFLECVENIFDRKCKAFILDIFNFKPVGYSHVMIFAYELRNKLNSANFYNFFYSGHSLFTSGLFITAKIKPSKNDIFLCLYVEDDQILITEYLFTDRGGYDQTREEIIEKANEKLAIDLREKILRGLNPKNIIVYGSSKNSLMMRKLKLEIFSNRKIKRFDANVKKESIKHLLKISKYVCDRKIVKYHVIPKCAKKYEIYIGDCIISSMTVDVGENLPRTFDGFLPRIKKDLHLVCYNKMGEKGEVIYSVCLDYRNLHRSKLLFSVDRESFPLIDIKPQILDVIYDLPTTLNETLSKRIPVIVFCDNFTVICAVKKGEAYYSFLDGWNGIYGNNASMFFNGLRRLFGFEAMSMKKRRPANCLTDIIQIMSEPNLGNVEDQVFKDGVDREAIVCFYMNQLLQIHFDVIREETGQFIKDIAFWPILNYGNEKNAFVVNRLLKSVMGFNINFYLLNYDIPQ